MVKTFHALAALALASVGGQAREEPPALRLKEERMIVEYTASANEAVVLVEAESEAVLGRVEVRGPRGNPVLALRAGRGQDRGLAGFSGFLVESQESELVQLLSTWGAGDYDLLAWTVDGQEVLGRATLHHALPRAPEVVYPSEGAMGVPTDPVVSWVPDPSAEAYVVVLEQDENDGLTVRLEGGTGSFQVPAGVLRPATETQLEVAAVDPNGNRTLVEVLFTTR